MDNANLIERLKKAADVTEDQALAEIFGMSKASFSYAKKNCSFSISSIAEFAQKFDCDLNWLITGKTKDKELDSLTEVLMTGFDKLDQDDKLKAVTFVGNLASKSGTYSSEQGVNQTVTNSTVGNLASGNISVNKG